MVKANWGWEALVTELSVEGNEMLLQMQTATCVGPSPRCRTRAL
jgi:hypothetical protein